MPDSNKAIKLIVPIFVAGLLAAFLLPVAVGQISGDETTTYNQTTTETVELQPGLNATLDSVNAGSNATYTVEAGGDSASATVDQGSNATVTVDGAEVTINPTDVGSGYAVTDYSYPTTYGWGDGATALWGIIPVMMILAVFLYFTYRATQRV